jgi:hypothetical protein
MTHDPSKPIDRQNVEEEGSEPNRDTCDFCQSPIKDEEEGRFVAAGDESLTLCESCGEHYLD